MDQDYKYAKGRQAHRIYVSKRIQYKEQDKFWRYGARLLPDEQTREILKEAGEAVVYSTPKGNQQVKVKFLEDGRGISHLWLQRWNTRKDIPVGEQFVLYGDQIRAFLEFVQGIKKLEIPTGDTFNVDIDELRLVHLPDDDAREILHRNPDLVAEFARNEITTEDIISLAYRRNQLNVFSDLLAASSTAEQEWQSYFEANEWIFGYGLSYVYSTSLDDRKLQQSIRGSSVRAPGKEPDGLLKTRAAISATCLVEIKRSLTPLLKRSEYRAGTWAPSAELTGAIAQCQENSRVAVEELGPHHKFVDSQGFPTGEELMTVSPKSFLIIGSLDEFSNENGVNVGRYRAFEDFRRNIIQPEILTFDELYERATLIVDSSSKRHNSKPSGK